MRLEAQKLLVDALDALAELRGFIQSKSHEQFRSDKLLQRAAARQLEIIREAIAQLNKLDATLVSQISHSRQIIAFRNVLIHNYGYINPDKVWDVTQTELDLLELEIRSLLAAPGGRSEPTW